MGAPLRSHRLSLVGSLLLCCVAYPLLVWGFAQSVTPPHGDREVREVKDFPVAAR